jgi:hypothetical protein
VRTLRIVPHRFGRVQCPLQSRDLAGNLHLHGGTVPRALGIELCRPENHLLWKCHERHFSNPDGIDNEDGILLVEEQAAQVPKAE